MSFGDRVVAQIRGDHPRLPPAEPNPLQQAYDDYNDMKRSHAEKAHECNELRIVNGALHAEVNMLREALERCDNDRIRLQGVSSTLTGQLRAINAVIGDAMRMAIKNGIEAVEAAAPAEQQKDTAEVRDILERVESVASSDRIPRVEP